MESSSVDAASTPRDDRHLGGRPDHQGIERFAARLGVLLGVVQAGEGPAIGESEPVEVEEAGRRYEGPGEATSSSLVGPGNEAPSQRAVEGEEAPTALGSRGPRAGRCDSGTST